MSSDSEVDKLIDVQLDRYSHKSQHFISYPDGSDFDRSKDGIHISVADEVESELKELICLDEITVVLRIRVSETHSYLVGDIEKLKCIRIKTDVSSLDNLSSIVDGLQQLDTLLVGDELTTSLNISRSRKSRAPERISEPEPPQIPAEDGKMNLYYVNTGSGDCYHTNLSCQGLNARLGDISTFTRNKDGTFPDEVPNLRKCSKC
ncbi:hypothetical protein [Haloferax elongans]|uniref:hypothetical protein n=1 Tax=Haloferax elongans TaxID=403191 RepID=UPI0012676D74|nr:hypothetical protein [Haloferax elongans]